MRRRPGRRQRRWRNRRETCEGSQAALVPVQGDAHCKRRRGEMKTTTLPATVCPFRLAPVQTPCHPHRSHAMTRSLSRRELLAAGAGAAGYFFLAPAYSAARTAGANERLRFAGIGVGG